MSADTRNQLIRRAALYSLAIACLATAGAGLLHRLGGQPHPVDASVPPLLALCFAVLFGCLWHWPARQRLWLWLGFAIAAAGIIIPTWWHSIEAMLHPELRLIDSLPPIATTLVPLALMVATFQPFRQALVAATLCWLLVAAPVLGYLALHPEQLLSPRGLDLVIALGPVMMLVLVYIPFHRGIERQLSTLKVDRARMQALAERDVLTGLYNRRAGESFLKSLTLAHDHDAELVLFDIDHFKSINDRLGHAVGDEVLREIAARCAAGIADGDVVARWGGEEFLLLARVVPGTPPGQVAETLRQRIAGVPIGAAGHVTASFGVTRVRPGDDVAGLLQRADEALYQAKRNGRDQVVAR